jgi:hypothetical protein
MAATKLERRVIKSSRLVVFRSFENQLVLARISISEIHELSIVCEY